MRGVREGILAETMSKHKWNTWVGESQGQGVGRSGRERIRRKFSNVVKVHCSPRLTLSQTRGLSDFGIHIVHSTLVASLIISPIPPLGSSILLCPGLALNRAHLLRPNKNAISFWKPWAIAPSSRDRSLLWVLSHYRRRLSFAVESPSTLLLIFDLAVCWHNAVLSHRKQELWLSHPHTELCRLLPEPASRKAVSSSAKWK